MGGKKNEMFYLKNYSWVIHGPKMINWEELPNIWDNTEETTKNAKNSWRCPPFTRCNFFQTSPAISKKECAFSFSHKKNQLKFAVWLTVDQSTFDQFRRDLAALQFMNSKS